MISATPTTQSHGHPIDGPIICQNCGQEFKGRYCNPCGQRADTHRINWHYIWHEIPHSVWHVDQGILFTLRELLTRPGYTIRDFLNGKRVNHYRPLALLLILGAVVVFAQHSLNVSFIKSSQDVFGSSTVDASARLKGFQAQVNHFIERNQNLIHIATIPLYAFWIWVMFRRRSYNYPELLVAQTFIANFGLVVSLVVVLLFWALGGSSTAFSLAMSLTFLALIGYTVVVCLQLFRGQLRPATIVMRSLAAYLLGYLNFLFIALIVGGIYGFYLAKHEPNYQQTALPKATTQLSHP